MELMQKNKKHFGIRIEGQWRHVIQSLYNLMKKQWVQMIPPLIPGSIMTSAHSKPKQISTELKRISLKKHQLLERKKMQDMIDELRSDFGLTEKTVSNEICSLDEEVKQLTEREIELQKSLDEILCANERRDKKEVSEPSSPETDPVRPATSSNVFFVEAPPTFPAAWLVVASFRSATKGSNPSNTNALCVERQFRTSKSSEGKQLVRELKLGQDAVDSLVRLCFTQPLC